MKHIISVVVIITLCTMGCPADTSAVTGIPGSIAIGLDPVEETGTVHLPPVDSVNLLEEDRRNMDQGVPARIGINRPVPGITFDDGQFIRDEDLGLIWRMVIMSEGAYRLRVHLEDVVIPPDGKLFIYSIPGESELYRSKGPSGSGDFWSWSTVGDSVVIEWNQPAAVIESIERLPFHISAVSHAYRDPTPERVWGENGREGACHNDATCDMTYREQRDASAYIEFNDNGWYICSGTMLNNTAQDFRPFFITANHCISSQSVAQTIQVYFFFHTSVCNAGSAPVGAVRNGANMRAHGAGSDFSLLELTSTGFNGVYFAGWDRNTVNLGDAMTSVHHPDGAYKRISYGSRINYWGDDSFWDVRWDRTANPGVTEGGSSGSGLFRETNRLFIGQLYGGTSSCSNQSGPDTYGRFGVSYSNGNLSTWLGSVMTLNGAYYGSSEPTATPTTVQPTHTPQPTSVPPATNTPIPTFTPPRTPTPTAPPGNPTYTPLPTETQGPNPTGTPPCQTLGCRIEMPSTSFGPGDDCYCRIIICNPYDVYYWSAPLFVVFEFAGEYFFAPGFGEFDFYEHDLVPGTSELSVLDQFTWPSDAGSFQGAAIYAGMTDHLMIKLFGEYDMITFGWHQ